MEKGRANGISTGNRASSRSRLRPSRTVALALVGVIGGVTYFLAIVGLTALLNARAGTALALTLMIVPLVSAMIAAVVLPAPQTRAWLRVMIAKHLYRHRYDYRAEWLRFTDTLAKSGTQPRQEPTSLVVRVVKAVADIADSTAGLLLLPDGGEMLVAAEWNWPGVNVAVMPQRQGLSPVTRLSDHLASGRIVDLDAVRATDTDEAAAIPDWILAMPNAWAIVPLIHVERLAGAVILNRPLIDRTLDWEDFDLLRVVGRQVASHLAEAQGQDALSEARRFEEFNRRFAFIMHDVKNLVSQLGLLARNAERHADNPAFRVDMIATLNSSTARMNDLLARLSQHNNARPGEPRAIGIGRVVAAVAAAKRLAHPVVVTGDTGLVAMADPAQLEAALAHLVQNAIDASPRRVPVTITLRPAAPGPETREAMIEVADRGCGMTSDFLKDQLFRPFASTKEGGFGIGAHEARDLIIGMGGRLEVTTELGSGSSFTIALPSASADTVAFARDRAA